MTNIDKEQSARKGTVTITDEGIIDIIDNSKNSNYLIRNHRIDDTNQNIFIFDQNSGKDTINNTNANDKILIKDAFVDSSKNITNIKFTKSQKTDDLIIEKNINSKGNAKDKITVEDYFKNTNNMPEILLNGSYSDKTYIGDIISLTDYYIETSGKGNIYGIKDYKNKIIGSKKSDIIYSYNQSNYIDGGKSNDIYNITIGENIVNKIRIKQGDGNDTINFNWDESGNFSGIPNIIFDQDVTLSYEKELNDLIIRAIHSNKKNETVRIKNYFTANSEKTHIIADERITNLTTSIGENTDSKIFNINDIELKIQGVLSNKIKGLYVFEGSDYNDIITGNNKLNDIYTYGGTNIITTGKKGGTVITSQNANNNTINISNLSYGTIINNNTGTNEIYITASKLNDIHTVKLGTSLFITTSSGLKSLSSYVTTDDYTLAKTLKGCLIKNYFSTEGEISNTKITVRNNDDSFDYTYNTDEIFNKYISTKIKTYLTGLHSKGLNYDNAMDLLMAQGTSSSEKKKINSAKSGLIDIYKHWYIGTDNSDLYTIQKGGAIIDSNSGSDQYTFKGILGDGETIISSHLQQDNNENDTFVFNKYSFEDKTLFLSPYNNNYDNDSTFVLTTVDYDKKLKYSSEHNIIYMLDYEENIYNIDYNSLIIKDSKRRYEISAFKSDEAINIDISKDTTNHIFSIKGDTRNILSNTAHNIIYTTTQNATETEHGSMTYTYNGGYDYILSIGYSDDTYNVSYDSNTHVDIDDSKGINKINISGITSSHMRLFTDVILKSNNGDYEYVDNNFILTDEYQMKRGNITSKDGNITANKGFIFIGTIEELNIGQYGGQIDISEWLNTVAYNVAGWLINNNKWGYQSSTEVLESGNKTAIDSLLKVYTNTAGTFYKQ